MFLFISFKTERDPVCTRTSGGGAERGGRERIPGRPHTFSAQPDAGFEPTSPEIVT